MSYRDLASTRFSEKLLLIKGGQGNQEYLTKNGLFEGENWDRGWFWASSFIGIDLLKFQVSSYSALDKIDVGVYVVTTRNFQKRMKIEFEQN
jgi:hypothetical protein